MPPTTAQECISRGMANGALVAHSFSAGLKISTEELGLAVTNMCEYSVWEFNVSTYSVWKYGQVE